MSSAPPEHFFDRVGPMRAMDVPETRQGRRCRRVAEEDCEDPLTEPLDFHSLKPFVGRRTRFDSAGSLPRGLVDASDDFGLQTPGVYHKFHLPRKLSPLNFVMPDRRMPVRCPCCGADAQLHCAKCAWNTFFQPQQFARKREEILRKKARLATSLKEALETETSQQLMFYAKRRKVEELRASIEEKKRNIKFLENTRIKQESALKRVEKMVDALKKKTQSHKERIRCLKDDEARWRNKLSKKTYDRNQLIFKLYRELASFFPIVESGPELSGEIAEEAKITQMIEEAAFSDRMPYSEVAKRNFDPKQFYRIRGTIISANSDYSELLTEISERRAILSTSGRSAMSALAFTVHFVSAFAHAVDLFVPFSLFIDDLSASQMWTRSLFLTDVFCLNLQVALLCLHLGVPSSNLRLNDPFRNLLTLKQCLGKNELRPAVFSPKSDRLHAEIVATLKTLVWEDFDENDVEDDWVSVVMSR